MSEPSTSCRITAATNNRLRELLAKSRLSRDQFVDFLLNEAIDQIEGAEVSYEPLRIILTLRREHARSTGETLQSRLASLSGVLSRKPSPTTYAVNETVGDAATSDDPETLLRELVLKLQQNPRAANAIATLLDLTQP